MKINLIESDSRGHVNPDWLSTYHTYSFGRYYDPSRMGFGALRVVNDDVIGAGKGFDYHQHDNMEIVTIVLDGALKHRDSMGNESIIKSGEVQAMSAGTGVFHSEENASEEEEVSLIQIWIETRDRGVKPRYDQKKYDFLDNKSGFGLVVAPDNSNEEVVKIFQDAWLSYGYLKGKDNFNYSLKNKDNGLFIFVLDGSLELGDLELLKRDAVEVSEVSELEMVVGAEGVQLLVIEVPLDL